MSASDIHLKIDGIKGESTSAQHRDEIAVESWTWGVVGGPPPGGGSGKPSFSDLSFTHRADRASPLLWRACASGQNIKEAVLSVARAGSGAQDYMTIRLRSVRVTAVALADSANDGSPPLETVSLAFGEVRYGYRPQRANGMLDAPIEFGYDLRTNKLK
jgi:type VI secretion system secreted protein Hcp